MNKMSIYIYGYITILQKGKSDSDSMTRKMLKRLLFVLLTFSLKNMNFISKFKLVVRTVSNASSNKRGERS